MKIRPIIRVIISNTLIIGGLVGVWLGYGPLPLIPAIAARVYLHRMMTPRVPEFVDRGHPFLLHVAWYFLAISAAVVYFATVGKLLTVNALRIYAFIVIPILFLGSFFDDIRYARKMERGSNSAA